MVLLVLSISCKVIHFLAERVWLVAAQLLSGLLKSFRFFAESLRRRSAQV